MLGELFCVYGSNLLEGDTNVCEVVLRREKLIVEAKWLVRQVRYNTFCQVPAVSHGQVVLFTLFQHPSYLVSTANESNIIGI